MTILLKETFKRLVLLSFESSDVKINDEKGHHLHQKSTQVDTLYF